MGADELPDWMFQSMVSRGSMLAGKGFCPVLNRSASQVIDAGYGSEWQCERSFIRKS